MTALIVSLCLLSGTWLALRGGFAGSGPGLRRTGLDPNALGLAGVAVVAAIWFFGWMFGLAFVLAVMLHEYGHVAAYRVCGHNDATFRLLPLVGGQAISSRIPASHAEELFITLLGPAIGLAPMLLLTALSDLFWTRSAQVADFLMVLSMVIGGLNAFNLMPFWPLDGGRIVRVLTYTFVPRATQSVTLAMSALAGALAIWTQSYFLFFFVLLGLSSLFQTGQIIYMQRGMTRWQGMIGLAAYLTTTLSFCWVAFPLLAFFR